MDYDILSYRCRNEWGVLCDKAFQRIKEQVRAVHPKKEPRNGRLIIEGELVNRNISTETVSVDTFLWEAVWTVKGFPGKIWMVGEVLR